MKICTCCHKSLPADTIHFYPRALNKDGLTSQCRECEVQNHRKWREDHPNHDAEYRRANREVLNASRRAYYIANREKIKAKNQEYKKTHREEIRAYRIAHREEIREQQRRSAVERLKNPKHHLARNTSRSIWKSLRDGKAGRSWESLVGYTLEELMAHLEIQFAKGMTWDNYGKWQVDHIRPISDFNFCSPEDPGFKECWSLWNLQPMWGKDNLSKGARCEKPPLPLIHRQGNESQIGRAGIRKGAHS